MPDIHHPSGYIDYVNLNKDSTHPNPWKPPSRYDQLGATNQAAYKIYKPQWENWALQGAPGTNMFAQGPLGERLGLWAYRGFLAGITVSYIDAIYLTQSRSIRTLFARFLYLTPPVMAMPVSYVVSREVLAKTFGDEQNVKTWPYVAASVAPAAVWGVFRNSFFTGLRMFGIVATFAFTIKYVEDLSGPSENKIASVLHGNSNIGQMDAAPFYFNSLRTIKEDKDPGAVYRKFLRED